jgi:hypothetical protein
MNKLKVEDGFMEREAMPKERGESRESWGRFRDPLQDKFGIFHIDSKVAWAEYK